MFDEGIQADATGRVRVERGPVSLVISAWEHGLPRPDACLRAAACVDALLAEITAVLPLLSVAWPLIDAKHLRGTGTDVPLRMWEAAQCTGHPAMTPMCAVAGAIGDALAEKVLAEMSTDSPVKIVVSNGGDVRLCLRAGTSATVGLVPALDAPGVDETVEIHAADPVRGVATSGLGGRGFTQGIADAVTVFAATGAKADALATRLCNASFVDSPRVVQRLAGTVRPGCDIAGLPVTVSVGTLTEDEKDAALEGICRAAQPLIDTAILYALRASVQGKSLWLSGRI